MTHKDRQTKSATNYVNFQIRVQGHLGPHWREGFEGLTVTALPDGDTMFSGPMADQAALHGVLKKVRNLGLPLVSVNPMTSKPIQTIKEKTRDQSN